MRSLRTEVDSAVIDAIYGFEIKKLGSGRIFECTHEQMRAGQNRRLEGVKILRTRACAFPSGPRYIDIAHLAPAGARFLLREHGAT